MTLLDEFSSFVTTLSETSTYKNWCNKSPKDCTTWQTYSKSILAGQSPPPPAMNTGFGKSLVQVGVITLFQKPQAGNYYGTATFGDGSYSATSLLRAAVRWFRGS